MAQWQAYQAHAAKNSPTLVAGQTIAVNKYTVQVERYLSQGMICACFCRKHSSDLTSKFQVALLTYIS